MQTLPPRRSKLVVVALSILANVTLLTAVPLYAQEVPGGETVAVLFYAMLIVIVIPSYIFSALTTQIIAKKTNTENGWLAWIPIANFFLWADIAKKPVWWGILCIVPLVGYVFTALIWVAIAEARKKPNWLGILSIVPVVNLIVLGYLAWSD
jgi:uncharacterized membrane protein